MFKVPASSSSPPSTPQKRNFFASSNPSTTPAGPPPTSFTAASTTPAGPPPSSVYGSVQHQSIPFSGLSAPVRAAHRTSPSRLRHATAQDEGYDEDAMEEDQDLGSSIISDQGVVRSVEDLNVPAIAKALAIRPALLHENDGLILETENTIESLHAFFKSDSPTAEALDNALSAAVETLQGIWKRHQDGQQEQTGIGPGNNASAVSKSLFLSSLILSFHHTPRRQRGLGTSRGSRGIDQPKPIPEVLLDWLREHHNQYPNDFLETLEARPNSCAHDRFWDVVLSLTLRGNIANASRLLKEADFRYAVSALDDGAAEPGYEGKQLGNVQRVVNRAIVILDSCPAVTSGDWNVKAADWSIFRKRVTQALSDLEAFAEGLSADKPSGDGDAFEAENFGLSSVRSDDLSISKMSRRAESKVPWSIYQNLVYLYGQLLGMRREIVAAAADWVEATIALTVWWDGDDNENGGSNIASSRRSFRRSQGPRSVDILPRTAYQQKMSLSLQQVMSENDDVELRINTTSPIQVGLACIFDNDLAGLVTILEGWSWPVATAVVEVAQLGSWLNANPAPSRAIMDGFDQSDLMVLSFAQQPGMGVQRDATLIPYAEQLYARPRLQKGRSSAFTDGWELAVQVLGRLDNPGTSESRIAKLLDELDLTVPDRIEKVMSHCFRLNLPGLARSMSDKYADDLATHSHNYGGALYYYSRAHNSTRVKEVVDVLISCSVVQSIAYPPAANLDSTLASIINSPKQTLARLAMLDREAAELLSAQMSGYAMLRNFYVLRDHDAAGTKPATKSLARRREAAASLVAIIESAADSIHGGLHDTSIESAVQVDVLLVLLGEALVFLNQPKRILKSPEIFALMRAAEDISTVSNSIYGQCEEVLKSALLHAHGDAAPPSPRAMLASVRSARGMDVSMTGSSSDFSLIGSSMVSSRPKSGQGDSTVVRGWDWRIGLRKDAGGETLLKILRLGLAREISRAWMDGEA